MEKIVRSISIWCGQRVTLEEGEQEYMEYGLYLFIDTVWKYILIMTMGAMFGALLETVIIMVEIAIYRIFAGGYHSKTSFGCFFYIGCVCFASIIFGTVTSQYLSVNIGMVMYCIVGGMIWKYVPLQSEKNPIKSNKDIRLRKCFSLILVGICLLLFHLVETKIGFILLYGLLIETSCIYIETKRRGARG